MLGGFSQVVEREGIFAHHKFEFFAMLAERFPEFLHHSSQDIRIPGCHRLIAELTNSSIESHYTSHVMDDDTSGAIALYLIDRIRQSERRVGRYKTHCTVG